MKAASAILFTVLYALFSCFAVTGFAAAKCPSGTCKQTAFSSTQNSVTNADDICTHPFAAAVHTICKSTNNLHGGCNKYLSLNSTDVYKNSANHTAFSYKQEQSYFQKFLSASRPLFIKHCVFLL